MFQHRIKELREGAGFKSQQAFADAFGVAQSTVAGWETGKREPDYKTTQKLAHFFNVSIDYLLGMPGAPNIYLDDSQQEAIYSLLDSECQKRQLTNGEVVTFARASENFFPRLAKHYLHQASGSDLFSVATYLGVQEELSKIISKKVSLDEFTYTMQKESRELSESEKEILLNIARQMKAQRLRTRTSPIKIAAKGRGEHVIEMEPEQVEALKQALAQLPNE